MTIADRIEIESDERGFELHVWVDEEPEVHENGLMILNIQSIDLDAFYDQVKARIGPWLRERDEARATLPHYTMPASGLFACDPDFQDLKEFYKNRYLESVGYDVSDPKHPAFHSTHADIWDNREGK